MKNERFSFLFQRCSLIYLTLVQTERKMRLSEKKTELAQVFSSVSILSKYKMKSERFSFLFSVQPDLSKITNKTYVRTIISINNIKASKKLSSKKRTT